MTTVAPNRPASATRCGALLALSPLGLLIAGMFTLDAPTPHFIGFFQVAATPTGSSPVAGAYFRAIPCWRRFGTWVLAAGPVTLVFLTVNHEPSHAAGAHRAYGAAVPSHQRACRFPSEPMTQAALVRSELPSLPGQRPHGRGRVRR